MPEKNEENKSGKIKKLGLSNSPGKLEIRKTIEGGTVRQSFSHGRIKSVAVEVKKIRTFQREKTGSMSEVSEDNISAVKEPEEKIKKVEVKTKEKEDSASRKTLSDLELQTRKEAIKVADEKSTADNKKKKSNNFDIENKDRSQEKPPSPDDIRLGTKSTKKLQEQVNENYAKVDLTEEEEARKPSGKKGRADLKKQLSLGNQIRRKSGKITLQQAFDDEERQRSLASVRRARQKEKKALEQIDGKNQIQKKVVREVIVPEFITVQDLANRMAVRSSDVIKVLISNDVMVTATQTIDADTAEIVVLEFGHTVKRISEADVEIGLRTDSKEKKDAKERPPIITVMGHVDHGKTTLLDSLRDTDIVQKEEGGITQHIGAYQINSSSEKKITFVDTPGHEAFSAMRARGAKFTDIVVLVVAANDGVMPQTVEAIKHAKAAKVPIILAINKIDVEGANSEKVQQELLQHDVIVEKMGGDIPAVEISALKKQNLEELIETIELQADILELKTSYSQRAEGVVIESKREQGRGVVASILLQSGTLTKGEIVVAGSEWGRIRAIISDKGEILNSIDPSTPAEILGLNDIPLAGDELIALENETRAKEISEYRKSIVLRKKNAVSSRATSIESVMNKIETGEKKHLPIVLKTDAVGSQEAISASIEQIGNDEVSVQILLSGVGGITESDITLAVANEAVVFGFNVRADAPARKLAKQQRVEIRYFSIIYEIFEEIRSLLSGLLDPIIKETILGYAEVKNIFKITKVGKVAGCEVTEGLIRKGEKVRIIRDGVVVHNSDLSTLKRHTEEVSEVKEGMECGVSLASFHDISKKDVIECYHVDKTERIFEQS